MPISNPFRRTKKDKPKSLPTSAITDQPPNSTQPQQSSADAPSPPLSPQSPILFRAQLAHGSPPVTISGFSNIRELYEKIASAYKIPSSEVLFCTLNSNKCDMEKLIGAQIGLDDFIYCHVKGESKHVTVTKSEPALGLTITDNGNGYAFIKRIRDESISARETHITVGDHISAIDGNITVGCRHYEVARTLKEIPLGTTFTISLVEPKKAFNMLAQRNKGKTAVSDNNVGTGKATLRLRSQGPATLEAVPTESDDQAVKKIDDLLESFLGIRDLQLASTVWECGKSKQNPDEFVSSLEDQLSDFGFPQEFIFDCWGVVLDIRSKNTF